MGKIRLGDEVKRTDGYPFSGVGKVAKVNFLKLTDSGNVLVKVEGCETVFTEYDGTYHNSPAVKKVKEENSYSVAMEAIHKQLKAIKDRKGELQDELKDLEFQQEKLLNAFDSLNEISQ